MPLFVFLCVRLLHLDSKSPVFIMTLFIRDISCYHYQAIIIIIIIIFFFLSEFYGGGGGGGKLSLRLILLLRGLYVFFGDECLLI